MNIIGIQCRSTSKRFPNKIMQEIGGIPLVRHIYNTCSSTGLFTVILVPTADKVIPYLKEQHIPYYEGSEDDVLSRYYHCAKTYNAKNIIRVTADCPLLDDTYIRNLHRYAGSVEYGAVVGIDGQDVELFSMGLLELAHKEAQSKDDREHVTPWMQKFVVQDNRPRMTHTIPFFAPKMSVDTKEDLKRVREIYANRHPSN